MVLTEHQSSVPSPHIRWSIVSCNSSLEDLTPLVSVGTGTHMHTQRPIHVHIIKNNNINL